MDAIIDAINETPDTEDLSDSDTTYLKFRRTVEPGLVSAGFDITPAKSKAYTDSRTGEQYIDQVLRSHILNGAAFAARFNNALEHLDPDNALTQSELIDAMALYAVHDLHKTRTAQKRAVTNPDGRDDPAMDIRQSEITDAVETLRLGELDTSLSIADYRASAYGAEQRRGLHRETLARQFINYRNWVRLMDAAASTTSPTDAIDSGIENRAQNIAPDITLHYHRLDTTTGVTTNLLNKTIQQELSKSDTVEPVVQFHNGEIYAATSDVPISITDSNKLPATLKTRLSDEFMTTVRESRDVFKESSEIESSIIDQNISKGYLNISRSTYFTSGLETAFEAVRSFIETKADYGPDRFSVYEKGIQPAYATGLIDTLPESHVKIQSLALYLGTVFDELFRPLCGNQTRDALTEFGNAFNIPELTEFLLTEHDTASDETPFNESDLDPDIIDELATHLNWESENVVNYLTERMDLHDSTKPYGVIAAATYLHHTPRLDERPVSAILEQAESDILTYYQSWGGEWSETWYGEITEDDPADACATFESWKAGELPTAVPVFLEQTVEIDGWNFEQTYTEKTKMAEYTSGTQPHLCMLCGEILTGESDSLQDYTSGKSSVGVSLGFTHHRNLQAEGGEPVPVVCPICELEMTLRNSAHKQSRKNSHYLMVAPDYFYSPADVKLQKHLRDKWQLNGNELFNIAKQIIEGGSEDRADVLEDILDIVYNPGTDRPSVMKNYDTAFNDQGAVGVYRLDAPRKRDSGEDITEIPHALLDTYFSILFAWATGSRVLLTDTPTPTTEFEEFPEMVHTENMPAAVERTLGGTSFSISYLKDLAETDGWLEHSFGVTTTDTQTPFKTPTLITDGGTTIQPHTARDASTDTSDADSPPGQLSLSEFARPTNPTEEPDDTRSESGEVRTRDLVTVDTEFGAAFYTLSSMVYLLPKAYDFNLQYLGRMSKELKTPFAASKMILKGRNRSEKPRYSELVATDILETFITPAEQTAISKVATAGFNAREPQWNGSNQEYELLYRAALDAVHALPDDASPAQIEDAVTEAVQPLADNSSETQIQDLKTDAERRTYTDARRFASVFVSEVIDKLCENSQFNVRRFEHEYAAGYNAELRRQHHESYERQN